MPEPRYGEEINTTMMEVLQQHNLTKMNNKPTRMDIVDQTTNPDPVSVYPGIRNHMVVISELDISAKQTKKDPREMLPCKNGNMAAINDSTSTSF